MLENIIYLSIVFMGFFSIMNPMAGISIFLTLTCGESSEDTKKIAFQATLTAFLIVFVFAVAGHLVLDFFRVSYTALRLTGGFLVGVIGYDMLHGKQSAVSQPYKETIQKTLEEEGSYAVTPLGIPLLAGPGVIITAMNFSAGGLIKMFTTIIAFGILCIITYYVFVSGQKIKQFIGINALKVITKMMGLILVVIGMQMLIDGVYNAVREFH